MKILTLILMLCSVFTSLVISFCAQAEQTKPSPSQPIRSQSATDLKPLPVIKTALTNKNETATAVLLEELRALIKAGAHEQFLCGNTFLSSNTVADVDPLSHPRVLFDAVLIELLTRKSEKVTTFMGELLLSDEIGGQDHRTIWIALRGMSGKAFPVVLEATDPSQERKYLLKITTDSNTEVEVKKGDTLLRIAKRAYPALSRWSAVEVIAFMNGFYGHEQIKAGTKLKIYPYQILKDTPAAKPETQPVKSDK